MPKLKGKKPGKRRDTDRSQPGRGDYRSRPIRGGDLHQRKALGQVFLKEAWPCERVVDQLRNWEVRHVLEIGPGRGALTELLIPAGFAVTAVEKDERFAAFTRSQVALWSLGERAGTLNVVESDILKFDFLDWLDSLDANGDHRQSGESKKEVRNLGASQSGVAIVGNIPYNISTPILLKTFGVIQRLTGAVFLTQLEFAERLAAPPGGKDYGSLSVLCSLYCERKVIGKVPRTAFEPVPKVDSALIALTPRKPGFSAERIRSVEVVSRQAFQQRRKMLRNSIAGLLPKDDENASRCPVDLNRRPETLSLDEFMAIADYVRPAT